MTATRRIPGFLAPVLAPVLALSLASAAWALPPLNRNAYINDRLVAAQIGDVIRKTCPSIHARILHALSEGRKLEKYARDLGYSKAQIDAFTGSKVEQQRVKDAAAAYMAANGVVPGDVESYCRLGRAEIARRSITGSLLYGS